MKHRVTIAGLALSSLLIGCASTPVAVAPVGPNPAREALATASDGQLEVFSAVTGRAEGDNPTWYQHTDYTIYNQAGKAVKYVRNAIGHYSSAPRPISLPPGKYFVKAEAKDYPSVWVPVMIVPGRTTRVHLDGTWRPDSNGQTAFVRLPTGNPIGWKPQ